ncbi:uncharacterized protein LOC110601259 isoform X3 [Manihot esculenta]|uniref:uncharacterized protein LOC110601259 isoform X3 n=1 Tax=Manihot esculenta TaxID=3983 RepID=UPI001CC375FD|nr:uncharacterized protein LOC110601259 isoform X3 [Manihot esculenta]
MLCSLGTGRMAVMARLLAAGSLSQTTGEEIGEEKLATQCIYRELHEADEANFLDEEELCRSLNFAEETTLELADSVGHRKPPKKERKKLSTSYINQATLAAEQRRSVYIDANDITVSESQLDAQPGRSSSFSMDAKRNPSCVAFMMDGQGESPEHTDHSVCIMPPPTKRSKFVSSQHLLVSNDPEAASGLTKIRSAQDSFSFGNFQIQSTLSSDMPNDCGIVSKFPGQAYGNCLLTKDIPIPLSTKIYYSQRNNRLRLAVAHMYHASSVKGLTSNVASPEVSQETIIQLPASSCKGCTHEQVGGLNKKRDPSACKHDQILTQSSELCLDKSGRCTPATGFFNQLPVDNILRPQASPVGLLRSKYLQKPYSFGGNSGQSVGNMQQASGSVPIL